MTVLKTLIIGDRQSGRTTNALKLLRGVMLNPEYLVQMPKIVVFYIHKKEGAAFWSVVRDLFCPDFKSQDPKKIKAMVKKVFNIYLKTSIVVVSSETQLKEMIKSIEKEKTLVKRMLFIDNEVSDVDIKTKNFDVIKTQAYDKPINMKDYDIVCRSTLSKKQGRLSSSNTEFLKHPTLQSGDMIVFPIVQ